MAWEGAVEMPYKRHSSCERGLSGKMFWLCGKSRSGIFAVRFYMRSYLCRKYAADENQAAEDQAGVNL